MSQEQDNIQRFNTIANSWDADPQHVLMAQKVARAIKNGLQPDNQQKALEFGAGTGLASLIMAPHLAHLTALDSSAGMLKVLRQKCERKGLENVEIIEGSASQELPAGPFDLIYSAMTLHHIDDVPALLGALAQRLSAGGRIALADLDAEDGSFHGADVAGVAHHGFDRAQLAGWLRNAGFEKTEFSTAYTMRRPDSSGQPREYPIFLAIAQKN